MAANTKPVDDATSISNARVSPLDILANGCKVQSLTVSDQHATLLLSHSAPIVQPSAGNDNYCNSSAQTTFEESKQAIKTITSLLKLTIVPYHKALLGSNP